MSWIRVECSGGARYAAPSFSPPPTLGGFDKLFACQEIQLREIHCYPVAPHCAGTLPASDCGDGDNGSRETEAFTVRLAQCELGGRLGTATIAVGVPATAQPRGANTLTDMIAYTESVLRSTNESGVRALLDAICTRPPPPRWHAHAAELVEDDGLPRSSACGNGGRWCQGSAARAVEQNTGASNRRFLEQLYAHAEYDQPADGASGSNGGTSSFSSASSSPAASLTAFPHPYPGSRRGRSAAEGKQCGDPSVPRPPPRLTIAAALRRQALLHFTGAHAVPVSLLYSIPSAAWTLVGADGKRVKGKGTSSGSSRDGGKGSRNVSPSGRHSSSSVGAPVSRTASNNASLAVVSGTNVAATRTPDGAGITPATNSWPQMRYSSQAISLLAKNARTLAKGGGKGDDGYWDLFTAAASECVTAVQQVMQKMLTAAFPASLRHLLAYTMWVPNPAAMPTELSGTTAASPSTPSMLESESTPFTPSPIFAAAYSPSGLLTASPSFFTGMSQEDRLRLSAVAVDAMTRQCGAEPEALLHLSEFPLMVQPPSSSLDASSPTVIEAERSATRSPGEAGRSVLFDICVFTIGDAVAFVVGVSRSAAAKEPALSVGHLSKHLHVVRSNMVDALDVLAGESVVPLPEEEGALLRRALALCASATAPHTSSFFSNLLAVSSQDMKPFISTVACDYHRNLSARQGEGLAASSSSALASLRVDVQASAASTSHLSAAPGPRYPQHAYLPPTASTATASEADAGPQSEMMPSSRNQEPSQRRPAATTATTPAPSTAALMKPPRKTGLARMFLCALPFTSSSQRCKGNRKAAKSKTGKAAAGTSVPASSQDPAQRAGPSVHFHADEGPREHGMSPPDQTASAGGGRAAPLRWGVASEVLSPAQVPPLPESVEWFVSCCYVAVAVTQLELNAFRPLEGTAVHSLFISSTEEMPAPPRTVPGEPTSTIANSHVCGGYMVSFFRPQLQDRLGGGVPGRYAELLHDATQLLAVAPSLPSMNEPQGGKHGAGAVSSTTLLPAYVLESEVDERDRDATALDERSGSESGEESEEDTAVITCLARAHGEYVSRSAEGKQKHMRWKGNHMVLGLEDTDDFLDAADVLHRFLDKRRSSDLDFPSNRFDEERKQTVRQLCGTLEPCIRAAELLLEGVMSEPI